MPTMFTARAQQLTHSLRTVSASAISRFMRRSLLVQLISVYLLFVAVVLIAGMIVNAVVEQRLRDDVQASDQALAQEIALDTSLKMSSVEGAVGTLGQRALHAGSTAEMTRVFDDFIAARSDVDHVYWLDPLGAIVISETAPTIAQDVSASGVGAEFSPPEVVQLAQSEIAQASRKPIVEVGIAEETTLQPGVIIAEPVYNVESGQPAGVVAIGLSLGELSVPLAKVVNAQRHQGRPLAISIVDARGELIATPDASRYLYPVLDQLPGASQALAGHSASLVGPGPDNQDWLYSSVPIPDTGWAVVVQRPTKNALAVVAQLHSWLLLAALIFAIGGLVFWLLLLDRVIRPLHALAVQHQAFPAQKQAAPRHAAALARRLDEVGGLARSVERLEHDVLAQFGELHTLLETSTAVVTSLDPRAVGSTIISEVRRLVDVQAAAVLVPDEHNALRVLVSEGRDASYNERVRIEPDDLDQPSARALHDGAPVQLVADGNAPFPPLSYAEGFRTVLAIPIMSPHASGVVLLVHRTQPQPFSQHEVDLLLTFANYAALAWEHAILYERSDERLREVARENERLYRQAIAEKQTLSAIMGSINEGLVLTGVDGSVLYANRGASALTGLPITSLEASEIGAIHAALRASAQQPERFEHERLRAERGELSSWLLETTSERGSLAISLQLFDVHDDGHVIGRGLLLRDVTQEREVDRFKSALLAAVGHELRTPLTAIRGHASTLLQDDVTWTPQDQRRSLTIISDEASRLAQLVTNLLDLSRLEAGLLSLHRESCLLEDLITSAVGRLSEQIPIPDIELADDLPPLDVDAARIEVVLQNLIINAATYGESVVRVSAMRSGDDLLVRVADDGPGVSDDDLPHIFERFYRAPRDQQRHSGGTGLGLAICKAFVEAHGGRIWAESKLGAGTTVCFTVPVSATHDMNTRPLERDRVEA